MNLVKTQVYFVSGPKYVYTPSKMDALADRLSKRAVWILDGALSTELERRGLSLDHPLWSASLLLKNPQAIEKLHLDYLLAGADIITTASYQATQAGFEQEGFSKAEFEKILLLSVSLAENARKAFCAGREQAQSPLIAASIGPYGAFLHDGSEYRGDYPISERELARFHEGRFHLLADSSADLIAFETIPCLAEARVLLQLLEQKKSAQAWFSFNCRNDTQLASGEALEEAVRLLDASPQVCAVGVNCVPPDLVPGLLASLRKATEKPIIVYPNSGERWSAAEKRWTGPHDPATFTKAAATWFKKGARLIGGCCRTTPEHIRLLRRQFEK